jgi:signal transduction histidine kinase
VEGLSEQNALALFRVLQEALQNVAKHAGACNVYVSLVRSLNDVHLRVRDSGTGFGIDGTKAGLGLTSMRERMSLAGGRLLIHSVAGRGTRLIAVVPARERSMPIRVA